MPREDDPPRPFPGCYWVEPGRLIAGEYPAGARLAALIDAGIGGFLDLSTELWLSGYAAEAARLGAARGREIEHRRFPIRDRGVPEIDTMRAILDAIDAWLAAKRPVYVHCYAGVGRTGTVVACHLVRRGWAPADALIELGRLRRGTLHAEVPSPETAAQWDFVAAWRAGW